MAIGEFIKEPNANRFVLNVDGHEAFVDYRLDDDVYHLLYSEVPAELRGAGIGRILVDKTFAAIAAEEKTAVAHCSYIRHVAKRSDRWNAVVR